MRKLILILPLFIFTLTALAQNKSTERVKVFLDCTQRWLCDFDFVRTELAIVDFVRDRFGADVHVLVNTQRSSSGGIQAQLNFIGQRNFAALFDTLTYFNDPTSTEDEQRKRLVQYLKLGLTRYIAKTDAAGSLNITFPGIEPGQAAASATKDPWNYWVFQFSTYGSLNGNQNYKSNSLNGSFSADRETEDIKINMDASFDRNVEIFKEDSTESRFERKGYEADIDIAKSINQHWSYGISAEYENSLFSNLQAGYELRPKLEFSIFPYQKFNSQRIVVQYLIGPRYFNYYDTTVYFKETEWQIQQSLNLLASFTKPWGSVNMGIFYSNFLEDFKKNNLSFNGAVSWRIVKGLNFALWGNYGLIHDQINLRKGKATRDELLVRNRELQSNFSYNLGIGISYRFGSILNNIVNPRFRGLNYSISL